MSAAVPPQSHAQKLAAQREFVALSHGTTRHLKTMRQDVIFSDGVLPARLKALAAALWSVSARCEPCIHFYMHKARELGATREEMGEVLAVASVMGGCVGETWAAKAFAEVSGDQSATPCCDAEA